MSILYGFRSMFMGVLWWPRVAALDPQVANRIYGESSVFTGFYGRPRPTVSTVKRPHLRCFTEAVHVPPASRRHVCLRRRGPPPRQGRWTPLLMGNRPCLWTLMVADFPGPPALPLTPLILEAERAARPSRTQVFSEAPSPTIKHLGPGSRRYTRLVQDERSLERSASFTGITAQSGLACSGQAMSGASTTSKPRNWGAGCVPSRTVLGIGATTE